MCFTVLIEIINVLAQLSGIAIELKEDLINL